MNILIKGSKDDIVVAAATMSDACIEAHRRKDIGPIVYARVLH